MLSARLWLHVYCLEITSEGSHGWQAADTRWRLSPVPSRLDDLSAQATDLPSTGEQEAHDLIRLRWPLVIRERHPDLGANRPNAVGPPSQHSKFRSSPYTSGAPVLRNASFSGSSRSSTSERTACSVLMMGRIDRPDDCNVHLDVGQPARLIATVALT